MSKFVKGIVKKAKRIVKSAKKVFKTITSSTLGKVLLGAVAIYTGGVLFGAWGQTGPMSGMFGAWGSGATSAVGSVASNAAPVVAKTAAPVLASTVAPAAISQATPSVIAGVLETAAPAIAQGGSGLAGYASQALGFMKENPLVTAMGFQGLSSALSPDQTDLMREQERLRRERFESLSGVGDVSIGMRSSGTPLRSLSGGTPWHERLRRSGGG